MAIIIALAFASCGSEKEYGDAYKKPCYEESKSDPHFFREIGYGIHSDLDKSSEMAIDEAYTKMEKRLEREYRKVIDTVSIVSSNKDEEREYRENALREVIQGALRTADNACYDYYKNKKENKWYYFYVIEIQKFNVDELIQKELNKKQ